MDQPSTPLVELLNAHHAACDAAALVGVQHNSFGSPVSAHDMMAITPAGALKPLQPSNQACLPGGNCSDANSKEALGLTSTDKENSAQARVPGSPLAFAPTYSESTPADSHRFFSRWVESTSPYVERKTPPTASMASVDGGDGLAAMPMLSSGSDAHFARWLQATDSIGWTPKSSAFCGMTPASTPARSFLFSERFTPASPSSAAPSSMAQAASSASGAAALIAAGMGAAAGDVDSEVAYEVSARGSPGSSAAWASDADSIDSDGLASSGEEDVDDHEVSFEAAFTPQPGAAGADGRFASPAPASGMQQSGASVATAADLLTPLSNLGLGARRQVVGAEAAPPASPVERVIGLMMGAESPGLSFPQLPGAGAGVAGVHAAGTPAQRGGRGVIGDKVAPPSPAQRLIGLMMERAVGGAGGGNVAGGVAGGEAAGDAAERHRDGMDRPQEQQEEEEDEGCYDYDDGSDSSGDEIDVEELTAIFSAASKSHGPRAGLSPLSDIIDMMLSPELRPSAAKGTAAEVGQGAEAGRRGEEGMAPRTLFGG